MIFHEIHRLGAVKLHIMKNCIFWLSALYNPANRVASLTGAEMTDLATCSDENHSAAAAINRDDSNIARIQPIWSLLRAAA
jgi:hypothetical protein